MTIFALGLPLLLQMKGVAMSVRSMLAAEENRRAGGSALSTLRLPQLSDEEVCEVMLLALLNEVRHARCGGGVRGDEKKGEGERECMLELAARSSAPDTLFFSLFPYPPPPPPPIRRA